MKFCRPLSLLFALSLFIPSIALANAAPAATRDEVRRELAQFFAHIGDHGPGAFGAISQSPEAVQAVQKRINSMSDAEIDDLRKMMTQVPDWQNAPQQITKMLPEGALKKIQSTSADFEARAPQTEKMRQDIGTLAGVLDVLPDDKLKELGIQRSQLGSLQAAVTQLSPLQAGVLDQRLAGSQTWQTNAQTALGGMPAAMRDGALALSRHGPLTKDDVKDLEQFRAELITLLDRVNSLPEATRKQMKIADLGADVLQIDRATPEILFMLRAQINPDQMKKLSGIVELMHRIADMTDADRQKLEGFRTDLESVFDKGDHAADNQKKLDSLSDSELLLLQEGMPNFAAWKETTGAVLTALTDPGLGGRLTALKQPTPDPAIVASLEQFRAQTLATIETAGSALDPTLVTTARTAVSNAPLAQLEILRTVVNSTPGISAQTLARVANDIGTVTLNCDFSLGCIHIPVIDKDICLPDLNLSVICNPIQTAINAIDGAINTALDSVQSAVSTAISDVQTFLKNAIDSASTFLSGLISTVTDTANQIFTFVKTIPDLVWNALKTAINAFLDLPLGNTGLTIRTLISGGLKEVVPALQNALNLGESFWNSLNDSLPLLPCPPAGFATPFGAVGTDEAVTKYNRYHFFIEKIVGMIPSDAISLEIKIPAEVLYSAWDYLGLCLQDAANATDSAQQAANYTALTTSLTTITNNEGGLSNQITAEFGALSNLTNSNSVSLTNLINSQGSNLTTLIDDKTTEIENLIKSRSDDAQKLELQLQIELNLAAGEGNALAMFELPKADGGFLETARDIVNSEISNMLAAGQAVGQAQKFFNDGLTAMAGGQFKNAYDSFQKAYREVTRKN